MCDMWKAHVGSHPLEFAKHKNFATAVGKARPGSVKQLRAIRQMQTSARDLGLAEVEFDSPPTSPPLSPIGSPLIAPTEPLSPRV